MRTYVGIWGEPVCLVGRSEPGEPDVELPGNFTWGNKLAPGTRELAKGLLLDLLPDEPGRALRLHTRFMHRTTVLWKSGQDWSYSENELRAVIKAIDEVAEATVQTRIMADQAPVPVDFEANVGPAGTPVGWDQTPTVGSNIGKEPDRAK